MIRMGAFTPTMFNKPIKMAMGTLWEMMDRPKI